MLMNMMVMMMIRMNASAPGSRDYPAAAVTHQQKASPRGCQECGGMEKQEFEAAAAP